MPGINKYENKIPAFYRRRTMEILLFGHVTALHERSGMSIEKAIRDFMELYCIDEEEYPVESAKVIYNRIRNNYIWSNLKQGIDRIDK